MKKLLLLLILSSPAAASSTYCAKSDFMKDYLQNVHGVQKIAEALTYGNNLLQIWENKDQTKWLAVIFRPSGVSCVVAEGSGAWEVIETPEKNGEKL